ISRLPQARRRPVSLVDLPFRVCPVLGSGARFVVATPAERESQEASTFQGIRRKLLRAGVLVAVLVGVGVGIISLVPGLCGVGSAIKSASVGWVVGAAGIQLIGVAGAVVFVQLVFRDVVKPLTWRMGGGMQAANSVMPTAGSTGVSYWTLSSIGWGGERFAERTAVMIIAPAAPNFILIIVVGLLMGLGVVAGPSDWW